MRANVVWSQSPAAMIGERIDSDAYDPKRAAMWRSAAGRAIEWKDGKPYYKDNGESAD